jgi:large subunit ribosomal protein L15
MDLSNLKPAKGSVKGRKRIGRGQGSGKGGTSTRGNKGAQQRSGYKRKLGFEGGQMPLYKRVPKFGFKNINRISYRGVNLQDIQKLSEEKGIDTIDFQIMVERGLASKNDMIKILGKGKITSKLNVEAHSFSASAIKAIEEAGGIATRMSVKPETEITT